MNQCMTMRKLGLFISLLTCMACSGGENLPEPEIPPEPEMPDPKPDPEPDPSTTKAVVFRLNQTDIPANATGYVFEKATGALQKNRKIEVLQNGLYKAALDLGKRYQVVFVCNAVDRVVIPSENATLQSCYLEQNEMLEHDMFVCDPVEFVVSDTKQGVTDTVDAKLKRKVAALSFKPKESVEQIDSLGLFDVARLHIKNVGVRYHLDGSVADADLHVDMTSEMGYGGSFFFFPNSKGNPSVLTMTYLKDKVEVPDTEWNMGSYDHEEEKETVLEGQIVTIGKESTTNVTILLPGIIENGDVVNIGKPR